MRHSYQVDDNKIICVSHYRGKTVQGIAKCDLTHDTFNEDVGKKLSFLRCKRKISAAKLKQATKKYSLAREQFEKAEKYLKDMEQYFCDANYEYITNTVFLEQFERSLNK